MFVFCCSYFWCNYFSKVVSVSSCLFFLCVFLTYELLHGDRETKK